MAITIKKSKLTLKAPVAETPVAPEGNAAAEATPAGAGPAKEVVQSGPSKFQIVALILVILSFGIYGALFTLQWVEWSFYHQPPTAFPEFVPSMAAAATAAAPTPPEMPETLPEALKPASLEAPAATNVTAPAVTAPAVTAPAVTAPAVSNTTSTSTAVPPPRPKPTRPPRPADMPDGV